MSLSKSPLIRPALALLAAGTFASLAPAENWPSWRGPSHSGSRAGADYPTKWDADSATWKVKLPGKGASCPAVWNDRIYITSPSDGQDVVLALDLAGKELWRTELGDERKPKHKKLGTSSNASPVTDGEAVFVHFKSGNLAALEADGKVRWQRNLAEEFGPEKLYWDAGSSPVLAGDLLVLPRLHGGESWVAGFDKATGEIRWKEDRNFKVPSENDNGYTTPVPVEIGGSEAFLLWCSDHLTAHSSKNGSVLWTCGDFNPKGMKLWPHIATPVVAADIAVIPVGRDDRKQAAMHGIRVGSKAERIWKRDDVGVFVASPVEADGRIYLLRNKGGVVCLDPATGNTHWEAEFPKSAAAYYASPVVAGGNLYGAREDGMVFSARVGENFKLLGENDMGEQILASPVPFDGKLLLRGSEHLFLVE